MKTLSVKLGVLLEVLNQLGTKIDTTYVIVVNRFT